jgi:hypothetical protein
MSKFTVLCHIYFLNTVLHNRDPVPFRPRIRDPERVFSGSQIPTYIFESFYVMTNFR